MLRRPILRRVAALAAVMMASPAAGWDFSGSQSIGIGIGSYPRAVAVSPGGDVIAVGLNLGRMAAFKLSGSTGKELWRAQPKFPSKPFEWLTSVALASNGDLIVGSTGWFGVLRLAAEGGANLWQTEIHVAGELDSAFGYALTTAVDAAGDVLAAGSVREGGSSFDPAWFAAVKLDGNDGSEVWRYAIRGTSGTGEAPTGEAHALAMESSGDVVASGVVDGDLLVVKLAGTDGREIWRYTAPAGGRTAIAVAPSGDVFVAFLEPIMGEPSLWTNTLVGLEGTGGTELWRTTAGSARWFNYQLINKQVAVGIGTDGDVIAGFDTGDSDYETRATVLKADPGTGTQRWQVTAPMFPYVIDSEGNLLGFGQKYDQADASLETSRFAVSGATGAILASERVAGPWLWRLLVALHPRGVVGAGRRELGTGPVFAVLGIGDRLRGRALLLLDPVNPASRKLRLASDEPWFAPPASSGDGSPLVAGASLEISNPITAETVTIPLPAANWTVKRTSKPGGDQYRYTDLRRAAGPCKSVVLTGNRGLKAVCGGAQLAFGLDEPSQQRLRVRLSVPGGFARCLDFGGEVVADVPGRFSAKRAAEPADCSGGF
jgi:outer membrane protein assembly factor BamB